MHHLCGDVHHVFVKYTTYLLCESDAAPSVCDVRVMLRGAQGSLAARLVASLSHHRRSGVAPLPDNTYIICITDR